MNKRNLIIVINVFLIFLFYNLVFAGVETIKDDNDGNKGSILINTGIQQGNNDVGHWTNIKDIPELKGDKGDIGERGLQGIQGEPGLLGKDGLDGTDGLDGVNGIDGKDGLSGIDGYTPIKNIDYFDGKDGINGTKGDKGDKGDRGLDVDPLTVDRLDNTDNTLQNNIDKEELIRQENDNQLNTIINNVDTNSQKRDTILNNKNSEQDKVLNNHENRIGELEETDVCILGEVDFIREKNITIGTYGKYDMRHNEIPEVGLKITIGLGESWEQREINKMQNKIKNLEERLNMLGAEPEVTKTKNGWEISISEKKMNKLVNKF